MSETFVVSDTGKYEIVKDPQAVLDYSFDWTTWLGADTITAAVCSSDDVLLQVNGTSHNGKIVTAWVSGGTTDGKAKLTCHITTQAGREDERSVYLKVKNR